ncbi:MAG: Na+:solute symporter, partial [Gemmatimonadetes bacterium]|nr:Na+:solute symporter [Gemmatimonadota bacterium]
MRLSTLDWLVVFVYGVVTLAVGLYYTRRASAGTTEFFLGGRQISWWMLGTSLVATTFSTDTPNLVTDMVRTGGVSQNWLWWAFVLTGMTTVFFYAKLWRRSGMLTDIGFYELRYSGRPAAFLRGFRAIYLGVFFNVMIMATVTLAAIKIAGVMFGWGKYEVAVGATALTALYCMASGLWGAVVTDFLLFIIAMAGSFTAAYFAVTHPDVGGLAKLFSHPSVQGKLSLLPDFSDTSAAMAVLIVPLAVQWRSAWYPGAEPGGGGYVAQRMLAAKTEKDALKATLFFNVAHYALRPWPWILVALASLIVYPSLESIQTAFPHLDPSFVRNDLAYPAMLVFLPHGVLGLVVASLAAAYMSTVATHLNWGASYMVDDVYRRFMAPDRSERHYVGAARVATLILVVLASAVSLWLQNALQAFQILLQIGAGTGLVFLMRWFWWRINAWSELAAMVVSFLVAIWFQFGHVQLGFAPMASHVQLVVGVAITTVGWMAVTLLTPPADVKTLQSFYDHIRPMGPGWRGAGIALAADDPSESASAGFLAVFLGCAVIYASRFGTGYALYGRWA